MASTAVCPFCFHRIDVVAPVRTSASGRGISRVQEGGRRGAAQELTRVQLETYCTFRAARAG